MNIHKQTSLDGRPSKRPNWRINGTERKYASREHMARTPPESRRTREFGSRFCIMTQSHVMAMENARIRIKRVNHIDEIRVCELIWLPFQDSHHVFQMKNSAFIIHSYLMVFPPLVSPLHRISWSGFQHEDGLIFETAWRCHNIR